MARSLSVVLTIVLLNFIKSEIKGSGFGSDRSTSINDDRPFRMNKINLIFQKAKRILPEDALPKLYSELSIQDRLEIEWKKQKASGLDEDGEQEAMIRRKFLSILNQFDLLDVYSDDFKNVENSVLDKENEDLFAKVLKKDKKLAKLWKKAELSAFSAQELEVLKAEFGHHVQKVTEYEQLKREVDRIEGISDNSIQRFRNDDGGKETLREKHSELKKAFSDVKDSFDELEKRTAEGASSENLFKDPRIGELWSLALKANLSANELESFREELGHFEKKINKHEYFLKEAEMAKANIQIRRSETPEFYDQLQERVAGYASKIKKWYTELKTRVSKSAHRREL